MAIDSDPTSELTVSVVICAYTERRWQMLSESISSVRRQSLRPIELIVCIDHNQMLADKCRDEWRHDQDSQLPVVVLENKFDGRLGSARNTGVEYASSDIVAFLDDDAAADPDWLRFLVDPYRHSDVVAVGGAPLPVFETRRPVWFPPQLDWVFGCYYQGLPSELAPVNRLIGASMSARRDALLEIGGFHSDNHDDMDMCHRLADQRPSQRLLMEPRAIVYHNVVAERVTWSYLWRRCFFVNKGKVKAFDDMGSAASMKADIEFVAKSLGQCALDGFSDLARGDITGIARFGVLLVSVFLAAAGNVAGRVSIAR